MLKQVSNYGLISEWSLIETLLHELAGQMWTDGIKQSFLLANHAGENQVAGKNTKRLWAKSN